MKMAGFAPAIFVHDVQCTLEPYPLWLNEDPAPQLFDFTRDLSEKPVSNFSDSGLALRELEALACFRLAVLLALHLPVVAREVTLLFEDGPQLRLIPR